MSQNHSKLNVLVVFGGANSEHEVSCLSAANVAAAIDQDKFNVHYVGITPTGQWSRASQDQVRALVQTAAGLPKWDNTDLPALLWTGADGSRLSTVRDQSDHGAELVDSQHIDVAMPILHGAMGEDGTIQGFFDMLSLPYTGSKVAASAVGQNKALMKAVLSTAGIKIGPSAAFAAKDFDSGRVAAQLEELTLPVFVKPAVGGSSRGITKVDTWAQLPAAVAEAARHDGQIVVEQAIEGREIEAGVLEVEDGTIKVSVPGEIITHTASGFYDYSSKYTPTEGETELITPAQLSPDLSQEMTALAEQVFVAIGAAGYARVDCFVTDSAEIFVNEINTSPGMTELSMFPLAWQATGWSSAQLLTQLINTALSQPETGGDST